MDWASCRLYLGVRFQAIASPYPFGVIAHSAALSCSRDSEALPPTADRTSPQPCTLSKGAIALFSSLT
ncbi:hypothetical protein H6F96_14595 [Microcoleus sp. FACHB-53]|nr:hypothetical protein [Microcoleus sp. FACHB-53]